LLSLKKSSDGTYYWYNSYNSGAICVGCGSYVESLVIMTISTNTWYHQAFSVSYSGPNSANVRYYVNGGSPLIRTALNCPRIDSNVVHLYEGNAGYYRDIKIINNDLTDDEIQYGYHNAYGVNNEFFTHYDLLDTPGSYILRDSTYRTNGNYEVTYTNKHDTSIVYLPIDDAPIICGPGKVFNPNKGLCSAKRIGQIYSYSYSVPGINNHINDHLITFWLRHENASPTPNNLIVIDYVTPRTWKIELTSTSVCASITTSLTSPKACATTVEKKWIFYAAFVTSSSDSPPSNVNSYLVQNTALYSGSSTSDTSNQGTAGATINYGASCASCKTYMSEVKIFRYLPISNPVANYAQLITRADNYPANYNLAVYYSGISSTMYGFYVYENYRKVGFNDLDSDPNSIPDFVYNPFLDGSTCPPGTYFDTVQCVPTFGYMKTSYPSKEFQVFPIYGKLLNTDSWTIEAWTVSGTVSTGDSLFNIIGLGDDDVAFMAACRTSSLKYFINKKLGSVMEYSYISSSLTYREKIWTYITLSMADLNKADNLNLYVEGDTSRTAKLTTSNWALNYPTNKLNYIMVGGALGDGVATAHTDLRVKNIRLWKGAISYQKMAYMYQRGYDNSWIIPDLLDSYDFSYETDALINVDHFPHFSTSKIKSVNYYPGGANYYESEATLENVLFSWRPDTAKLNRIGECAPQYVMRNGKCQKDEGAINPYSPELKLAQVKIELAGKEISADWTIEMWIKIRSMTGPDIPIMVQDTLDTNGIAIKRNSNANELVVYPGVPSDGVKIQESCGFIMNSWMHLVIQNSKEGNFFKVFIDPSGTDTDCPTTNYKVNAAKRIDSSKDFILGDTAGGLDGKIKEFRFWNTLRTKDFEIPIYKYTTLTQDEQYLLYYPMNEGEGKVIHDKINNLQGELILLTGTVFRDVWTRDYDLPICQPSHAFDATSLSCRFIRRKDIHGSNVLNNVVFTPNVNPVDSFTIAFWIYPKATISNYDLAKSTNAIYISTAAIDKIYCRVSTKNPFNTASTTTSASLVAITWSYVTCALNAERKIIVASVNGNFVSSNAGITSSKMQLNWVPPESITFGLSALNYAMKNFRFYSYYVGRAHLDVLKNYKADLGDPYLLVYSNMDDSYSKVYDPSNKIFDSTTNPNFVNLYEDREVAVSSNSGGMRLAQQVITDGILIFNAKTSVSLQLPIRYKSLFQMYHDGFHIRFQTRVKPPLTGRLVFLEKTNYLSVFLDNNCWNLKVQMYNYDIDEMASFTTTGTIPQNTWTWITIQYNPDIYNNLIIGIDQNFETFIHNFTEGAFVDNSNTFYLSAKGAAEIGIREFSIHSVGFSKNEAILNMNKRFDPGREIKYLLTYYRINEGSGTTINDIATGYYEALIWNVESSRKSTFTVSADGPFWTSDKDNYKFCKPHQFYINNVCVNNDKALWFTSGTSKSLTLPSVSFDNSYTVEFWLYAKYDPTPMRTEQLFIRNPSHFTKIELITGLGNVVTIRCRILEENSVMRSLDGKSFLEYKNIAEANIRLKWTFISCANSEIMSQLRFHGQISDDSVAKAFPVPDGTKFPLADTMEISKTGSSGFSGSIREMRVWNFFLSAGTSTLLMRSELRPMLYHTKLLAYYKLDESAGTKIYDTSFYSQTANFPANDASGDSPEWIEIQSSAQFKPKLAGPSEVLEKLDDPKYAASVCVDRYLNAYISGTVGPVQIPLSYKELLKDFTVRIWARMLVVSGAYLEIGRDKAFKIRVTYNTAASPSLVTFYAGESNKQIASKDINSNLVRLHFAVSSTNHTAYVHLIQATGNVVYTAKVEDLSITVGNTADPGIYIKYSGSENWIRSIEIKNKYIEYATPALFAENYLVPPITDPDIAFYVKPGEFYSGKMYDHSIYGKEIDVSISNPLFSYSDFDMCSNDVGAVAAVDSSGTEISISFTKKIYVPKADNKTAEEICDILFLKVTTKELGTSPKCEITPSKIKIIAGENPTFVTNTKIIFRQDTIYQENCPHPIAGRTRPIYYSSSDAADSYYLNLAVPAFTVYPILEFTGPTEHRMCSNLILNVACPIGIAKRPLPKFSVSCSSADCDNVNAILGNLPKTTVTSTITVPINSLKTNRQYTFKASITNIFGQSAEKEITIQTRSASIATIGVGGNLDKIKRYEDIIIKATAISRTCDDSIVAQGCQDFTFEMLQTDPKTYTLSNTAIVKDDCSTFRIRANSLNWDTDYWFIIHANSNISAEYTGSYKFLIRAPRIPPVVYIKGSEKSVGFSQPFTLEGDELYPYLADVNETLQFVWECTGTDGISKCRFADGNETSPISSKNATFDANLFAANATLKFCFKAISTVNNAKISSEPACQIVNIVESMTNYLPQIKTSMKRINPQDRLLLSCNALNPPIDETLLYTWEIVTNNIDINKFRKINDAHSIFSNQFLDILPNSLSVNETYTFKCSVAKSTDDASESTTLTLRFNQNPQNGKLSLYPSQGIELTTLFTIVTDNWIDPDDDYPLKYSFYYKPGHFDNPQKLNDNEFTALYEGISQNEISVMLPAGNTSYFNKMTLKVIVYDQNGGFNQTFTEISVAPIEADQRKDKLKGLLGNSSTNNTQELAQIVGMILNNINDTTPDNEKLDFYPSIINKFVDNFTVQDKGFGKNLHLTVLDVIDDAVKIVNLPTETVLNSLEVILNIMKYEKNIIKSVYPTEDYYENEQQNFGLPQDYIKKISHSTSNIFINLTDPNKNEQPELTYNLSNKMSGLISDIGVSMIKEKFASSDTYSVNTQTFNISGVRASKFQTKNLNISISPYTQVYFNNDGLKFKNMSNSNYSTYDILVYEIDKKIYPKNNQTLRSHITRMIIYNSTELRPKINEPIYPARITDCSPIAIKFGNIKLEATKAMPACSYYSPAYKIYAAKDRGLRLKKYNQYSKEVECVTNHLTDFAILEIEFMQSNINYYLLAGFMGFGAILHLIALIMRCYSDWSFVRKQDNDSSLRKIPNSEKVRIDCSEETEPNVIKGIVEIEEHRTHKHLQNQNCIQLLWYCYFGSNYVGKIIAIETKYYSKHAFALLFNLRYALLMAIISMLYRYDMVEANTINDQLFYSAILVPIVAVIGGVLKLMIKNTNLHVYLKRGQYEGPNMKPTLNYEIDTFSFKLAISYSIAFGIFAGSCAAVIMNEMIMPYKVSYHIANLFMLAAVADTLIFHTFIGIMQFVLFTIVYRFKKLPFLKVFTTAEIEEVLHVAEENIVEVIQS